MAIIGNPSEAAMPKDGYLETLKVELSRQIRRAPDIGIAACALALGSQLDTNPELADTLYDAHLDRPAMTRHETFNQAFRALQSQALAVRQDLDYPRRFIPKNHHDRSITALSQAADSWSEWIDVVTSDDARNEQFHYDTVIRRNQATKAMRGKAVKFIGVSMAGRFGFEPAILDIGTSQMHIPKHLAQEMPFSKTLGISEWCPDGKRVEDYEDKELSGRLRKIQRTRWRPSNIDGIDIFDPNEKLNQQWAEACSFYVGELLGHDGQPSRDFRRYQQLSQSTPKNVRFALADFSSPNPKPHVTTKDENGRQQLHEKLPKNAYDMITALTMTYQLTPSERETWFKNCLGYLKPGGVIILSDFAIPDPHRKGQLLYLDDWSMPWSYRTFMYDSLSPEEGFQEIFRWYSGRCRNVQRGLGAVAIFGKDA